MAPGGMSDVPKTVPFSGGRGIDGSACFDKRSSVVEAGTALVNQRVENAAPAGPKGDKRGIVVSDETTDFPSSVFDAMTTRGAGSWAAMMREVLI